MCRRQWWWLKTVSWHSVKTCGIKVRMARGYPRCATMSLWSVLIIMEQFVDDYLILYVGQKKAYLYIVFGNKLCQVCFYQVMLRACFKTYSNVNSITLHTKSIQ